MESTVDTKTRRAREPIVPRESRDDNFIATFIVTENCNLNCKYCYQVKKDKKHVMSLDVAIKAIDYIFENYSSYNSIIWDIIGGEPLLEIDLVDMMCDYIKLKMYREKHHWLYNYSINVSSNGILYDKENVQRFVNKNRNMTTFVLSLDGNKQKHDSQRVRHDGTGSFDDVMKIVPKWLEDFVKSGVKCTYASDDLIYLKDSVIFLWNLGIKSVSANFVYEDLYKEGDDVILENQLKGLADYLIDNNLYGEYSCSMLDDKIGTRLPDDVLDKNWCNSGDNTITVNYDGGLFPCIRFVSYSLSNKPEFKLGDIYNGVDPNILRPFKLLNYHSQVSEKCKSCNVIAGCGWCQALNYDDAPFDGIYYKVNYICKMHKARCRASDYYYAKLKNKFNVRRDYFVARNRMLFIMMENESASFCDYKNTYNNNLKIPFETFKKGIDFAERNFLVPVILLGNDQLDDSHLKRLEGMDFISISNLSNNMPFGDKITILDVNNLDNISEQDGNIMLKVDKESIGNIYEAVKDAFTKVKRINIVITDAGELTQNDLDLYEHQLDLISDLIIDYFRQSQFKMINVLTDNLFIKKSNNCGAGTNNITLAPNSKFYVCPAFYYNDKDSNIDIDINSETDNLSGNLEEGLKDNRFVLCNKCNAYQCKRCIYLNKTMTKQYNVPSYIQCSTSQMELRKSYELQQKILGLGLSVRMATINLT